MNRVTILSPALFAAFFLFFSDTADVDPSRQAFLETSIQSESSVIFKSKGKAGQAITFDIRDDIRRGQEFLKDKVAGFSVTTEEKRVTYLDRKHRKREKLVRERVMKPNFLLAVEDLKERRIREVRITDKGCVTHGFEVTKLKANGVGSKFEVMYPENMAVLALRTTVRAGKKGFREVVYTAYTPEIDTWQVRKAGLEYLERQIDLARRDLASRKVTLSALDGLDDEATPGQVALLLSIIEHIDPLRFNNCSSAAERINLVHEVLTIVGANTVNAYAYSRSPAGAMGLFQIVPDTYRRLCNKYPRAGLSRDFVAGCTDHVNAAKASLLLFDSDLADLSGNRLSALRKDGRAAGKYLAAAYNCGSGRVEKSARTCGHEWGCRLPEETKIYLRKFDVVWDLKETLAAPPPPPQASREVARFEPAPEQPVRQVPSCASGDTSDPLAVDCCTSAAGLFTY